MADSSCPTADADFVQRVIAGKFDPDVQARLQRGFSTYLELDTDERVPLEICLRMPSPVAMRKLRRDRWLVELARHVEGETTWGRSVAASKALDEFLSRGPWHAWRDQEDPPPGTSAFREALFRVARNNDGAGLSAKQVCRVVGHLLS
jgi:hypothetical protein